MKLPPLICLTLLFVSSQPVLGMDGKRPRSKIGRRDKRRRRQMQQHPGIELLMSGFPESCRDDEAMLLQSFLQDAVALRNGQRHSGSSDVLTRSVAEPDDIRTLEKLVDGRLRSFVREPNNIRILEEVLARKDGRGYGESRESVCEVLLATALSIDHLGVVNKNSGVFPWCAQVRMYLERGIRNWFAGSGKASMSDTDESMDDSDTSSELTDGSRASS